jgi:hypothetical protein
MTQFLIGYLAAIVTYLVIGFCIGCYVVITNLAHFHGAGFQWKRMAKHIGQTSLLWPMAVAEFVLS